MAKAKKKPTMDRTRHDMYCQARKEVEAAVKAGPIVRLVQIPSATELNPGDIDYWTMRLDIERDLLIDRRDKLADRKPPAALALQKCDRLLLENWGDRIKVQCRGNLWDALAVISLQVKMVEVQAADTAHALQTMRATSMRVLRGIDEALTEVDRGDNG